MGVDFILVTHLLLRRSLLASIKSTENSGTLWPSFLEVVFLVVLFRGNRSWTSSWKLETWSSEVLDERGISSSQRWKTHHCRPIHPWKYSLRLVPRTILPGKKNRFRHVKISAEIVYWSSRKTWIPPPPFISKIRPPNQRLQTRFLSSSSNARKHAKAGYLYKNSCTKVLASVCCFTFLLSSSCGFIVLTAWFLEPYTCQNHTVRRGP